MRGAARLFRMESLTALENAQASLDADIADAYARRDALILAARIDGHSWTAIGRVVGMTRQAAQIAAKRANGGELPQPGGAKLKPGARIRGRA